MVTIDEAVRAYAAPLLPQAALVAARAAEQVPALAERLRAAGVDPAAPDPAGLAGVPVLTKDMLIQQQRADPPFGGLLADRASVVRVFQSPGPLYEPQLTGPDPWRWADALAAAGFGHGDVVLNCFGYHLSPAGAMFDAACTALGARVVPGGIGNQDLQAQAIADVGITAYTGLPSYLKALIERFDAAGHAPDRWRVRKALVTAEPLPDSLRALLRERVRTVLMAYGTAEAGLIGYETAPGSGLLPAADVLVEICDLDTGTPLAEGEGEVVITLLRADYPLIRFGTGDLSAWTIDADGRARLTGVLGRVGQAVKVRGMFLHPRQAAAVLDPIPGVGAWRLLVERIDHRDELTCEIVPVGAEFAVVEDVRSRIRAGLRFAATVRVVTALPDDARGLVDTRSWE